MQSTEYPDLRFMEPRAWGGGRDGKAVRYAVVHYTAGSERSSSPLNGALNDQNRTDGTSTNYFVGSGLDNQLAVIQCVLTKDRGNAARTKGNRLGIQYEFCGTAQTRAQWLDEASLATLHNGAHQMARDCKKYDLPVRRLSVAETRAAWYDFPNGPKGIVGHVDITRAYPEDGGDHTDPGTGFPWDLYLELVQQELDVLNGDDVKDSDFDKIRAIVKEEVDVAMNTLHLEKLSGSRSVGGCLENLVVWGLADHPPVTPPAAK
jgi:hypothetical protein